MKSNNGHLYELLANIFAKEPTTKLLRLCQEEENERLFGSFGIDLFSDIRHLALEEQRELLAVEYARLFLAPEMLAPPYESLQRGEGRLWGESSVEVNRIYKKFGFGLDEDFKETPDHLSCELAFLAELSSLGAGYEAKKCFLDEHLLKWFLRFKEDVERHARLRYYKGIADLASRILPVIS